MRTPRSRITEHGSMRPAPSLMGHSSSAASGFNWRQFDLVQSATSSKHVETHYEKLACPLGDNGRKAACHPRRDEAADSAVR
jgi:hypothetical protein